MAEAILTGYIYNHEDNCVFAGCKLKQYKHKVIEGNGKSKKGKIKKTREVDEAHQLLLQHAKSMYRAGIQKFSSCTSLRI
jgi:hypothetical protein